MEAGSFTEGARQKAKKGQPIGVRPVRGGHKRERQARHAGERSTSQKYYRGSTCGTTALPLRSPISNNSWRYFGDHCLRVTKSPRTKVKAVSPYKGEGKRTLKNRFTYCGRALDDSAGESEDDDVQVPIPCAHGGLVNARCMLDRAEHLARGHDDPSRCVACRSAWPGGNRPPHPTALARRLPMSGQGERWVAMRSALQFALLFQRGVPGPGPSSNATTGVYSTLS